MGVRQHAVESPASRKPRERSASRWAQNASAAPHCLVLRPLVLMALFAEAFIGLFVD